MLQNPQAGLKSALFVDFDNIYLGLREIDPDAADVFATEPARWLGWLEAGMPSPDETHAAPGMARSILVRRCYLNPVGLIGKFRPYFTRSAFSVIDCPPLTGRSKNSADIHMVMDILDTLEHRTRFDEFIILSGDSDFAPVLLRLRAHDRRTMILNLGLAAEAYKAAATQAIAADLFLEDGLGVSSDDAAPPVRAQATTAANSALLERMSEALLDKVEAMGEIPAHALPEVFKEFPEFKNGRNWLGHYSLRSLTMELIRRRRGLRMLEGDIWRVALDPSEGAPPEARPESDANLRDEVLGVVEAVVAASPEPVVLAKAAHIVMEKLGPRVRASQWAGAGTFGALLESAVSPRLHVTTEVPGHVYDPTRHVPPSAGWAGEGEDPRHAPPSFERRISQVTGTPRLTRQQYALVFQAIAKDLSRTAFDLNSTSKSVRDQCAERGEAIARANVSFILRGIIYSGFRFGGTAHPPEPAALAEAFRNNVVNLCNAAQLPLSEEDRARLDEWILGEAD